MKNRAVSWRWTSYAIHAYVYTYIYSDGVKVRMTAGFSKKMTAALRMTEKCPELE